MSCALRLLRHGTPMRPGLMLGHSDEVWPGEASTRQIVDLEAEWPA